MGNEKEDRIFEIEKKISAINWDIERNQAAEGRITYRDKLIKELNDLKESVLSDQTE